MSVWIVLSLSGLLAQEPLPHPSTQVPYQAPVIRPFEPGRDFGRQPAEGDVDTGPYRRPLEAPVTVEAYVRSYEYSPTDADTAYEQGVASAEIRADQASGRLDGPWRLVDGEGQPLYELVLNDPGTGPIEGGWRGRGRSGVATSDGATLTLETVGVLSLERRGTGWHGTLTTDGHSRPASLIRPR